MTDKVKVGRKRVGAPQIELLMIENGVEGFDSLMGETPYEVVAFGMLPEGIQVLLNAERNTDGSKPNILGMRGDMVFYRTENNSILDLTNEDIAELEKLIKVFGGYGNG